VDGAPWYVLSPVRRDRERELEVSQVSGCASTGCYTYTVEAFVDVERIHASLRPVP
jgi:hypothetical protein